MGRCWKTWQIPSGAPDRWVIIITVHLLIRTSLTLLFPIPFFFLSSFPCRKSDNYYVVRNMHDLQLVQNIIHNVVMIMRQLQMRKLVREDIKNDNKQCSGFVYFMSWDSGYLMSRSVWLCLVVLPVLLCCAAWSEAPPMAWHHQGRGVNPSPLPGSR